MRLGKMSFSGTMLVLLTVNMLVSEVKVQPVIVNGGPLTAPISTVSVDSSNGINQTIESSQTIGCQFSEVYEMPELEWNKTYARVLRVKRRRFL